jgi:hypothetical protein
MAVFNIVLCILLCLSSSCVLLPLSLDCAFFVFPSEYSWCFLEVISACHRHYAFYFNHHADLTYDVSMDLSNMLNYIIIPVKITPFLPKRI